MHRCPASYPALLSVAILVAVALSNPGSLAAQDENGPLAKVEIAAEGIRWWPVVEYDQLTLTVMGPDSELEWVFSGEDQPAVQIDQLGEKGPADGRYDWELRRRPRVDPEVRKRLETARNRGDQKTVAEMRRRGLLPKGPFVQSGSFTIAAGRLLSPEDDERSARPQPQDGSLRMEGDLEVAGSKQFRMPHPVDRNRAIHFSALEGPEVGTYFRGSAELVDGKAVIDLPATFASVTETEGLTVQLTPVGGWARLYVAELSPTRLVVREADPTDPAGSARFDFFVQGVRSGFADFEVDRRVDSDR